jgi:SAM-dependent methyltransferase
MTRTTVHLYAQCWNDEFMLPFFFCHYDSFVDRYVVYDDGSTDRSLQILADHPKVEVRRFSRYYPDSFALSEQALSNQCWKESRGVADWVIVTDIDEHLFHPELRRYLGACAEAGVTLVPALGFQMISEELPRHGDLLCEAFPWGAPWAQMIKPSIFKPDQIEEIRFHAGRHGAAPVGNVRVPEQDEIFLLHYKYLGRDRTFSRHKELLTGLGSRDIQNEWGHRYLWSHAEFETDWEGFAAQAVDYRKVTAMSYPLQRRWAPDAATVFVETHSKTGAAVPPAGEGPRVSDDSRRGKMARANIHHPASMARVPIDDPLSRKVFEEAVNEHRRVTAAVLSAIDAAMAGHAEPGDALQPTHPHDLPTEDVGVALASTDRPDLLRGLMQISRETFGFYTRYFPFTIKHGWAAAELEALSPGSRALEIGAGLSPLPVFLARREVLVDCVDNSDLIRQLPPKDDWNEWGFFDYGSLHPNLAAYNCSILDFEPRWTYDAVYAIGVLAHMLAAERERTIRQCKAWLAPGGRLLVTLALVPSTEFLWNLSSGQEFESRSQHGTISKFLQELAEVGFQVADCRVMRDVYKASSDVLLVSCTA